MNGREERRAAGIHRVPVQALVELCGLDPRAAPAFEAESINLSGRGLHLRTGYVPDLGTPLVCRFEEGGREVIAEGVVAWASADSGGGEFGLMFTALDQGSVGVLRELTGLDDPAEAEGDEPEPAERSSQEDAAPPTRLTAAGPAVAAPAEPPRNDPGARVRLHIDGLGAPMKALVRSGSRSRVKVGSTLEMLRVGRRLEIENLERSARRAACIDAVEVMLDPQTGVPQLVVALHYEDVADVTPDPTVIDDEARLGAVAAQDPVARPVATTYRRAPVAAAVAESGGYDDELAADGDEDEPYVDDDLPPEDEVAAEAGQFQDRVTVVAQRAGDIMRRTGLAVAQASGQAATGLARMVREASARARTGRAEAAAAARPRRTTAAPPSGVLATDGRRLRPQSSRAAPAPAEKPSPALPAQAALLLKSRMARRLGAGAGLIVVAATIGAYATGGASDAGAGAAAPASSAAPAAAAEVTDVDATGNPVTGPAKLSTEPAAASRGVVADVPLFGPTPMATTEPAPLGPPPGADDSEDEDVPAAKVAPVADETFDAPPPKGSETWGRGQVHLPTIHRLRLSAAGSAIQGAPSATGFSVVLPGVKVMENGTAIANRDERIAKVTVENSAGGAKITFRFRSEVPPYRVRMRKDFVEFLISAPK